MKKILFFVASMLCISTIASAQTFEKGTKILSVGAGYSDSYGWPMSVSYEVGVHNFNESSSLGIGGYLGYAWSEEDVQYGADPDDTYGTYKYDDIFVALSANYHYTGMKKFDFYGGIRIGYDIGFADIDWDDDDFEIILGDKITASAGGVAYDVHVGARYYIFKNLALNAEVGYGISIASFGFSYKF